MDMRLREPTADGRVMPLSRYVREELLSAGLLVDPKLVLDAHHSLHAALGDGSSPYLVRRQRGQHRGKETEAGADRLVVFTDNSPAVWLHHHLLQETRTGVPSPSVATALANRKVPAVFKLTDEEKLLAREWPLLGRSMSVKPAIWTAGWKLSHIFPCSPEPADTADPLSFLEGRDPREYHRIRALRNMSPFNYFLSPKPSRYTMLLAGGEPRMHDLGEDHRVISWVVRVMRDEILIAHADARQAFDEFLAEAGLGRVDLGTKVDPEVTVVLKNKVGEVPRCGSHSTKAVPSSRRSRHVEGPRRPKAYQVSQGHSKETYSGFLCAPDDGHGGHTPLLRMRQGDVVLHKDRGRVVAVSLVEPMDALDPRLDASLVIEAAGATGACLRYRGRHLSMGQHQATSLLACLVTTIERDLSLAPVSPGYRGYALELGDALLADRADVRDIIAWASRVTVDTVADPEDD